MNWHARFARASRTILYETLRPIVLPFVNLFTTTWSICRHPIRFGSRLGDDLNSLRSALGFFSQAVLMEFVVFSLIMGRISAKDVDSLEIPFLDAIVVFLFVAFFLVQTLLFMPFFRLISGKPLRIYSFMTATAYFSGSFLTINCSLFLLVGGGMISFLGLGPDGFDLQLITKLGIPLQILFFVFCFLLFFVAFAGLIASFVGFINWLSLSHAVTRLRVTLALIASAFFAHLIAWSIYLQFFC